MSDPILIAKGETELFLLPRMANRHGLVAGATGTGKTISLQEIAEGLSQRGVSVFMADVGSCMEMRTPIAAFSRSITPFRSRICAEPVFPAFTDRIISSKLPGLSP